MPASGGSKDGRFERAASKDAGQRDLLVARLRDLLADESAVREVSMFGGRAFMVNEKMAVHASKDGDLLVRIDVADDEQLRFWLDAALAYNRTLTGKRKEEEP